MKQTTQLFFHGDNKKHTFFEGWYLKHQTDQFSLSLIPAFHIDKQGHASASIQVATNEKTWMIHYPASQFHACKDRFYVQIGNNIFSETETILDISDNGLSLSGRFTYRNFTPLASSIMGPFQYMPFMQCNHGILSMSHFVTGKITLNKEIISFKNGHGYIETNWGRSFPKSYTWTQCLINGSIEKKPDSILTAIANVPIGPMHLNGCIISIYYKNHYYRLTTYKGAKILLYTKDKIIITQGNYQLHIHFAKKKTNPLSAPSSGSMTRTIHESLRCKVRYTFYVKQKKLFDVVSNQASCEQISS